MVRLIDLHLIYKYCSKILRRSNNKLNKIEKKTENIASANLNIIGVN